MRLWRGDATQYLVRWFRADATAVLSPQPTCFGSSIWDQAKAPLDPIVGEVSRGKGDRLRGANILGYPGRHACGPIEAWRTGGVPGVTPPIVTNGQGVSLCCFPPGYAFGLGGGAGGGWCLVNGAIQAAGLGGAKGGGESIAGGLVPQLGEGGAQGGGESIAGGQVPYLGLGGGKGGGESAEVATVPYVGLGGAQGGGESEVTTDLALTGDLVASAAFVVPTGYLPCDGAAVSRSTYAALLAAITSVQSGTRSAASVTITGLTSTADIRVGAAFEMTGFGAGVTVASIVSPTSVTVSAMAGSSGTSDCRFLPFGGGDSSTTFNVPDLRRRVAMGAGGSIVGSIAAKIGDSGGAETVTLTTAQIPAHAHAQKSDTFYGANPVAAAGAGANTPIGLGGNTQNAGGGGSHENFQPSLVTRWLIKT